MATDRETMLAELGEVLTGRPISPAEYSGPGIAWVDRPMPMDDFVLPPHVQTMRDEAAERITALRRRMAERLLSNASDIAQS